MLVTLSPAKVLDFESSISLKECTVPIFDKKAQELNGLLHSLSKEEVARLMKLNAKQATEVLQLIQSYNFGATPSRQAIFAYNGIAFQGFDSATLAPDSFTFAQKHLIILSGLYGVLRPLDCIKPYRLEMQAVLANPKGKNLYNYWSDTITECVAQHLQADDNVWINLASNEYSKVINRKLLPKGHQIITPVFKQQVGNVYKQVTVYAKKARGMMARFIVENQLTEVENIKAFDTENYCFSPQLSTADEWVFIR